MLADYPPTRTMLATPQRIVKHQGHPLWMPDDGVSRVDTYIRQMVSFQIMLWLLVANIMTVWSRLEKQQQRNTFLSWPNTWTNSCTSVKDTMQIWRCCWWDQLLPIWTKEGSLMGIDRLLSQPPLMNGQRRPLAKPVGKLYNDHYHPGQTWDDDEKGLPMVSDLGRGST